MALDPYQPCPCGSGKKLKFCCHDLSGDIEKIHRMIEGDQPHAALRHVDATLAKHPGRTSLLDLKAMIVLSLDEYDAAQQVVDDLRKIDDKSPTAHALQALVMAAREQPRQAVDELQTALELVDVQLPRRVHEAIGAVGHSLLVAGEILAARGHLWLYQGIAGKDDTKALELLMRLNRLGGLPLLLRESRPLLSLPEDHPAAEAVEEICRLSTAGKWRIAAAKCDEVLPDHLDVPLLIYNRALLSGYLADTKNLVAGLRLYARQDIPHDDAVEAEAIAQLLDESHEETSVSSMKLVFSLQDEEACFERLVDAARIDQYRVNPEEFGDGPRPRAAFLLLDRDQHASADDLQRGDVPHIVGFVSLYGRQTDRAERLEMFVDNDERFESSVAALRDIVGDAIGEQTENEEVGDSLGTDAILSWRWHFPKATPPPVRRRLLAEEREHRLLSEWPDHPRALLGGKSPREAAADPALRLAVEASVLVLEQSTKSLDELPLYNRLREAMGLEQNGPIDPQDVDFTTVPLVRAHRVDLADAELDDLVQLYRHASLANAPGATRHTARELVRRGGSRLSADVFEQLFSLEEDSQIAVGVLDKARQWSDARGESNARWDMLELQLQLLDQNVTKAQQLIEHLQNEHIHETEIAEQLYQLMYMLGMIREDDELMPPHDTDAGDPRAAGDAAAGGIWTPDGAAGEGDSQQKLWLPG